VTPIAHNSIIQTTWWQSYQGQQLMNINHYQYRLVGGNPDYRAEMTDLLNQFGAGTPINAMMAACCSTGWTLDYVTAQPVYSTRLKAVTSYPNLAGLKAGGQAPSNVAADIIKETDFATRWGLGMWHQGGLISTDVAGGVLSGAINTALQTLAPLLVQQITLASGAICQPVIWNIRVPTRVSDLGNWTVLGTSRVMRRRTHFLGV
jgi:hypothetical protein